MGTEYTFGLCNPQELMSPLDNQAQSKRRDFPYGVVSLNYGSMDNEYKWVETRDESMLQVAMRKRSFDSFQAPSGGHSSGNGLSCCEDQFGPGDSVRDLIPQSFYSNAYMMGQNDYNFSGENCNDLGDNNIYKARQVPIPSTDICTPPPRLPSTNLNVLRHTKPITVGAALENLQRVRSARKNRGSPSPGGPIQMTSQVNFFAGPLLMRGSPGPASPAVTTPQPGPHAESPAQREGKRRKQEDGSPAKGFPVEAPPVEGSPARGSPAGGYPAEGYPVEGSSGEGSPAPGLASLLAVSASQAVTVPQDVPAPLAVPARPVSAKTPPAKAPGKALARTRPSSAASVQSDPGSHSHLESEISDLSGPQASDKSRKETGVFLQDFLLLPDRSSSHAQGCFCWLFSPCHLYARLKLQRLLACCSRVDRLACDLSLAFLKSLSVQGAQLQFA